jgi:heme exporter protein CcmD
MGGYAVYVWGSVGVTALLILIEIWQARLARQEALQHVRAQIDLDQPSQDKESDA